MDQPTFADLEYQGKQRKTLRELFLEGMDSLIPWQLLEERIRPFNCWQPAKVGQSETREIRDLIEV